MGTNLPDPSVTPALLYEYIPQRPCGRCAGGGAGPNQSDGMVTKGVYQQPQLHHQQQFPVQNRPFRRSTFLSLLATRAHANSLHKIILTRTVVAVTLISDSLPKDLAIRVHAPCTQRRQRCPHHNTPARSTRWCQETGTLRAAIADRAGRCKL